jgi:hypothetical protein
MEDTRRRLLARMNSWLKNNSKSPYYGKALLHVEKLRKGNQSDVFEAVGFAKTKLKVSAA